MNIEFNSEELLEIDKIKSKYPNQQSALMPVLWKAQNKFGWISEDVENYVAGLLNLSYSHVHGVATFYTMFHKKPAGKYHVQVCTNVSCMINGGEDIYNKISKKLCIHDREVTPDGKFSLEEVECMGACGGAPMIAINEDFFENADINKIDELLDGLN